MQLISNADLYLKLYGNAIDIKEKCMKSMSNEMNEWERERKVGYASKRAKKKQAKQKSATTNNSKKKQ